MFEELDSQSKLRRLGWAMRVARDSAVTAEVSYRLVRLPLSVRLSEHTNRTNLAFVKAVE